MTGVDWDWGVPPPNLALPDREVHVWCASLHQSEDAFQRFAQLLSADEQARAVRFHFAKDRNRFMVGRGILRSLLGRYLNTDPAAIAFCYSSHGKPALDGNLALNFNLSHSQDLVLYAFARHAQVGIDLEYVAARLDMDQIVSSFFSANEQLAFQALQPDEKTAAFFTAWTCKEAYLKAVGSGLTHPLNQIEVALVPHNNPQLLSIAQDTEAAAQWSIVGLQPAPNYQATLAIAGKDWQIRCWQGAGEESMKYEV